MSEIKTLIGFAKTDDGQWIHFALTDSGRFVNGVSVSDMPKAEMYNRAAFCHAMTHDEVLSNFNSERSRYGL